MYLISGADLIAINAADGSLDGSIDLENVATGQNSYKLIAAQGQLSGSFVTSAGDVDNDGLDDILIGQENANGFFDPTGHQNAVSVMSYC